MTISRRSFFTGLATLIAAPAIVRAESLMKLASTRIAKVSMRELGEYSIYDQTVIRLDVLYGSMRVRPEWTAIVPEFPISIDKYSERILAPMVNRLKKQVADAIMYGNGVVFAENNSHVLHHVPLASLLREARDHQFA